MKATSIVGIVVSSLSLVCIAVLNDGANNQSTIGWGIIATIYLLAFSIVVLVKHSKKVVI